MVPSLKVTSLKKCLFAGKRGSGGGHHPHAGGVGQGQSRQALLHHHHLHHPASTASTLIGDEHDSSSVINLLFLRSPSKTALNTSNSFSENLFLQFSLILYCMYYILMGTHPLATIDCLTDTYLIVFGIDYVINSSAQNWKKS